jgi:hypothetical protein
MVGKLLLLCLKEVAPVKPKEQGKGLMDRQKRMIGGGQVFLRKKPF